MQAAFEKAAELIAVGAEMAAVLLIGIGVVDALARSAVSIARRRLMVRDVKDVWLRLAGWILLSLEFALGADIARTTISPTWDDIGRLAAIAGIRTVLSIFLERDLSEFERKNGRGRPADEAAGAADARA